MSPEVATKAAATKFSFKLEVGIKNSENGHILVAGQKFNCEIEIPASYGSYAARLRRGENLALEQYAAQLQKELDTSSLIAKRLKNVDWMLFSKTLSVKELVLETA
jgi:hypothetical protein